MRIIGGKHRGRTLLSPPDLTIRPTSERTREALFNILMHANFTIEPLIDRPVLDICCGTGALGLEALSRGAAHCTFMDQNKQALALAEANARKLGEGGCCTFITTDATQLPAARQPVALAMMDAPYKSGLAARTLAQLNDSRWLLPHAIVAIEQDKKEPVPETEGFTLHTQRIYGKAQLMIFQAAG